MLELSQMRLKGRSVIHSSKKKSGRERGKRKGSKETGWGKGKGENGNRNLRVGKEKGKVMKY